MTRTTDGAVRALSRCDSMHELVGWLHEHEHEHEHAATAVRALQCFEPFGEDGAE